MVKMEQERSKNKLGQYFTPNEICTFMLKMSSKGPSAKALEPSAGKGAFMDALADFGFRDVTGVEIDDELVASSRHQLVQHSFITWEGPSDFDLVIGNPPYIRWKDLDTEQKEELMAHRLFGQMVNSLSDYLLPFIALSIEKLKDGGELIFITPSFWLKTKHSEQLRNFLSENGTITDLVDFGEAPIFKNVATSLIVFKFVKGLTRGETMLHRYLLPTLRNSQLSLEDQRQFRSEPLKALACNGRFIASFNDEIEPAIVLENSCRTLKKEGWSVRRLSEFVQIANGMVTGLDKAFRIPTDVLNQLPKSELKGVSKVLKGKDTQRLVSTSFSSYIDIDSNYSEKEVLETFPTLVQLLAPWKDQLQNRYSTNGALPWWRWSFYRSESFHRENTQKIFVPSKERLTHKPFARFTLATELVIATQDVTAMAPLAETRESVNYIAAFLTLEQVTQWIRVFGLMKGGVAEFSELPLSQIPFRAIDWNKPAEVAAHNRISQLAEDALVGRLSSESASMLIQSEFEELLVESGEIN